MILKEFIQKPRTIKSSIKYDNQNIPIDLSKYDNNDKKFNFLLYHRYYNDISQAILQLNKSEEDKNELLIELKSLLNEIFNNPTNM